MAARRYWGIPLPTWTASDPCHSMSIRVKVDLDVVATVFDSITNVLIEEQGAREICKYGMMMTSNERNGANSQPAVPDIMEKVAETKRQMTTAYPPLDANAELADLILHISSPGVYHYWEEQLREPNMYGPSIAAARAIESLREEALDTYETIRAELERQNSRPLFDLSNAIRLKLRVLESLLGFKDLKYRKLATRKSLESRSRNADYALKTNVTPAVIAITSTVIFGSFAPLGIAWVYSQSTIGTWTDMDFWFLVQNSITQLLSIFMAIYPISKSNKASKQPWHWALLFATVGVACSLGSIPIYLYLPTFWSGFVSFAGTVAQVSISVQLVLLAISAPRHIKQA